VARAARRVQLTGAQNGSVLQGFFAYEDTAFYYAVNSTTQRNAITFVHTSDSSSNQNVTDSFLPGEPLPCLRCSLSLSMSLFRFSAVTGGAGYGYRMAWFSWEFEEEPAEMTWSATLGAQTPEERDAAAALAPSIVTLLCAALLVSRLLV
jgi:hypothetical protein